MYSWQNNVTFFCGRMCLTFDCLPLLDYILLIDLIWWCKEIFVNDLQKEKIHFIYDILCVYDKQLFRILSIKSKEYHQAKAYQIVIYVCHWFSLFSWDQWEITLAREKNEKMNINHFRVEHFVVLFINIFVFFV